MSRILLRDLEPGRLYHIQARATDGEQSSQWSQIWDLQTTSDIMPPAAPTSLSWTVEGTAFKAVWAGPTLNQDGSTLMDFKDFQVKVYSPAAPGTIITYYTTAARFDFPFESNLNSFGTPRAQVNIEVRARDNTGNLSSAATATVTNPVPANVAGFTATGVTDAIALKWDANTDTDLKYYQVYQGTVLNSENTLVYTGLANAYVFNTLSTSPQYFKILAVDVFNSPSATAAQANATARSSVGVDTTPPAAPTGVTVASSLDSSDPSGGRAYIDVSWTGVADTDLQYYSIRYSTATSWEYINVPEGVVTGRINGLRPNTAYNVAVAAVDFQGNSSAYTNAGTYPITTALDTTAPAAPTGVTMGAGVTTVTIFWNENSENDVKNGVGTYEVQLDTANTFSTGDLITKQVGGTITSFSNLTSNTPYYARVRAIDASANAGSYSSIVTATPRYVANSDIQAGTINGDRITAATINGDRVIANSLDANTIKANTTFTQNLTVGSTFTMGTGGIMSSSNYSAGVSGWRLTETSLEINGGTIRAAALQLQSGHNMLHPAYADFEFLSTWYSGNIATSTPSGTLTATIVDTVTITPKYGIQCLRLVRSGGSAGDDSDTWLGASSAAYNVPVEQSTTYIFSLWIHNSSTAKNIQLKARSSDGTFRSFDSMTSRPANGAWTRYSGTLTTGAYNAITIGISTETDGTFYCDGLQLEPQFAGSTSPSTWKPPSQTTIDGGIIRTGSIQSTAAAVGLGGQPAWSINVAGGAQFGDATIRGRLVVGDPSNPTADGSASKIQSANYSAGTAGWIINNDGSAEFNNVTVRGGSGAGNYVIVGPSGGQQVRLGSTGSSGFVTLTTGRVIENAFSAITSSVGNSGAANEYAYMQILGPTVTGATGQVSFRLNSQNNDGTSNANASLNLGSGSVIIYDKDQMSISTPVLYLLNSSSSSPVVRVNAASGQTGNLLNLQKSSSDRFDVTTAGSTTINQVGNDAANPFNIITESSQTGDLIVAQVAASPKFIVTKDGDISATGNITLSGVDIGRGPQSTVALPAAVTGITAGTETVIMTIPSMTFKNGRAYRVHLNLSQQSNSASDRFLYKLRKGSNTTSGTVYLNNIRVVTSAQVSVDNTFNVSFILENNSGSDITTALTWAGNPANGTGQVNNPANNTSFSTVEDVGVVGSWSGVSIT